MKITSYESDTFMQEMEATWQGLKPLYEQVTKYKYLYYLHYLHKQLHAYVRNKLHLHYGDKVMKPTGPIPAHLLGNMWAQSWVNIEDLVKPYPDKPSIDVTAKMEAEGWTPRKMFEQADQYFTSLGLAKALPSFWSGGVKFNN